MSYQRQHLTWSDNTTNQAIVSWPNVTASGSGITLYPYTLQPVADPGANRDFLADRELTPVEWLRRQVDDVCFLARAA